MRGTLGLALIALALAGTAHAADRRTALAVGERAPDFTLRDQQGKPVRLSEVLRRRDVVVLAFYIQADTPG